MSERSSGLHALSCSTLSTVAVAGSLLDRVTIARWQERFSSDLKTKCSSRNGLFKSHNLSLINPFSSTRQRRFCTASRRKRSLSPLECASRSNSNRAAGCDLMALPTAEFFRLVRINLRMVSSVCVDLCSKVTYFNNSSRSLYWSNPSIMQTIGFSWLADSMVRTSLQSPITDYSSLSRIWIKVSCNWRNMNSPPWKAAGGIKREKDHSMIAHSC